MKLFLTILMLTISYPTFSQNTFSTLEISGDSTYGYSDINPLKMKKGNPQKSINYSIQFLKGLRTNDNQKLNYLIRFSVNDPNYNPSSIQLTNRYTGLPLNGKFGILDEYIFLTSNTMDTIKIYVDIYNKGLLLIPKGLKYVEK